VKLPRHHHAVAAVVPLAAQHHDALGGERRESFRQEFHHAMPAFSIMTMPGIPFRTSAGPLRAFEPR